MVGPTRPWAHELPDVILTGLVADEQLAAIYSGAHALRRLRRATRASDCPRSRRWPAERPSWPATCRRCARSSASARPWSAQGDMAALIEAGAERERGPRRRRRSWSWEDAARTTWGVYARASTALGARRARARAPSAAVRAGAERLEAQ